MELNKTSVTDDRFIPPPVACHTAEMALWRLCCRSFSSSAHKKLLLLLRSLVRSLLSPPPPPPPLPCAFYSAFLCNFASFVSFWCKSKQTFVKFASNQLATLSSTTARMRRWMKELEDRKKKEKKSNDNQRCDDKHIAGSVKLPHAIVSPNRNKIRKEP